MLDKHPDLCYIIITRDKEKELTKMKKVYEITISMCGELNTITLTNPSRKFLKVGYTEYSGAKIVAVKRIK
jgi:hypothetical protein